MLFFCSPCFFSFCLFEWFQWACSLIFFVQKKTWLLLSNILSFGNLFYLAEMPRLINTTRVVCIRKKKIFLEVILIETTRLDGGLHWKVQKFFFSWETFNKQDVKDSWSFFLGIWLKQLFGGRISSKRRIFLCGKAYTLTQLNLLDLLLTHIKWFSCLDPFWDKVWGVLSLWNLFPKKFLVSVPLKGLGML